MKGTIPKKKSKDRNNNLNEITKINQIIEMLRIFLNGYKKGKTTFYMNERRLLFQNAHSHIYTHTNTHTQIHTHTYQNILTHTYTSY